MKNRLLEKIALSEEAKKEAIQVGVIGSMGFATGAAASKIGQRFPNKLGNHSARMGALIGGLGIIGDLGAVKLNKQIEKSASELSNKYLDKIAAMQSSVTE